VSRLALTLFGSPRIEFDRQPITVDTRKAIALLVYLALTRQPHSRDALAALLWPEYDQSHAYAALRRTLSALNKALGGYGLAIERESIGLDDQADIWIDAEQFQHRFAECRKHAHAENEMCARCIEPLTQAVDLYREDFLAGFSLRDSAAFDDWAFFQTEQLRRELIGALDRLVRQLASQHDYAAALAHARRWIAIDPLHEPAHRALMQLYALTDQRAAALRQYQECARVLKQELDVEPLAETTQLYEAIKANKLKAADDRPPTVVNQPAPVAGNPFPLIGRTAELHTLRQAYAGSRAGRFVAITGEAGIGKTRLAEEFIEQVRDRSGAIITARCYEGEVILPYSLFADILRAAIAQPDRLHQLDRLPAVWVSEAARLNPELISLRPDLPAPPPLDNPSAQGRFFEGVTQVLLALCATDQQTPAILFLDDLNWVDEASLELWSYFVRRLCGHALLIIAAWRTENAPHEQRLQQVVTDLQRSGSGMLLSLAPLNQAQVAELTQACLPNSVDVAKRLYRETEGLPYFVVEYLEALRAHSEDWSLPRSVRDLLLKRLTSVSDAGRQLLQTAVVIGRSFDFDTLRAASGRSEEETVTALEELIAQRLIHENAAPDVAQAPRYDFNHEKLRELIYEETGLARRRLLHQRVAQALIDRQRTSATASALAGSIAQHYQLAGRLAEAAEYFYRAGEYAQSLYANAEALAHYQAALTAGYPDAARLHERLGDLHTLRGEYQAALQSYETTAALDRSQPNQVAHLEHKLGQVYQRQGKRDLAETHFAAALRALDEPSVQAQIYTDWSLSAHHRGDTDRALELAQRALELAEASTDQRAASQRAHAQAHNVLGVLARHHGDMATAEHHLQQSLAVAAESGDRIAHVAALNNLSLVYAECDAIDQALALTAQALAECAALGDRHREAALHNHLADLLHEADRSEEAMTHLKQAVTIFAEIGVESGALQPEIWKLAEW
jgi:DNA-binding SARP family transcriptional activator/tetratricopeptide (TPR) repeat protein